MTEKNTNAKTPNASFEERYRKKQQMQKHPMHLEGKRLSLTSRRKSTRIRKNREKTRFSNCIFLF